MDGQDEKGLQLEISGSAYFKFSLVSSRNNYKLIILFSFQEFT